MSHKFAINLAKFAGMTIDDFTEGGEQYKPVDPPVVEEAPVIYKKAENDEDFSKMTSPIPLPCVEKAVITIDISGLEAKLTELFTTMKGVQDEIRHIKDEIDLLNH
jgi:hypothetical protein